MDIRRIVPNVGSTELDKSKEFYADFLGLRLAMDMGWIATFVSPSNPTAQISVARADASEAFQSSVSVSIEVEDVDVLHERAVARGYQIVYPLTDEPWGVRRFAVADPNGLVINLMRHTQSPAKDAKPT